MAVEPGGRLHVLVMGADGRPTHLQRDPASNKWSRSISADLGRFVASGDRPLILVTNRSVFQCDPDDPKKWQPVASSPAEYFRDSKLACDGHRFQNDGWISIIGQQGSHVRVVDFHVP
jgi:hypothetical protein